MKRVEIKASGGKIDSLVFNGEYYHTMRLKLEKFELEGNELYDNPIDTDIRVRNFRVNIKISQSIIRIY